MIGILDKHPDKWMPEPNTGCYLWVAAIGTHGRPTIWHCGKMRVVAQVVCEQVYGPSDKWALHRCNTEICVNGDHLYWGTPSDNVADMMRAGRWSNGSDRINARSASRSQGL